MKTGIIPFPILNSSLSFVFVVKIYLKNLEAEPTASCILRRNFSSKILCLNSEFEIGNGIAVSTQNRQIKFFWQTNLRKP